MRFRLRSCLAVFITLSSALVPGQAAPVSLLTAVAYTYAPGDVDTPQAPLRVSRGGRLLYTNADPLGYHSVVSYDTEADGTPLFFAPFSGTSELNEVQGVDRLGLGAYRFYCDVHGPVMEGVLEVTPSIT